MPLFVFAGAKIRNGEMKISVFDSCQLKVCYTKKIPESAYVGGVFPYLFSCAKPGI